MLWFPSFNGEHAVGLYSHLQVLKNCGIYNFKSIYFRIMSFILKVIKYSKYKQLPKNSCNTWKVYGKMLFIFGSKHHANKFYSNNMQLDLSLQQKDSQWAKCLHNVP